MRHELLLLVLAGVFVLDMQGVGPAVSHRHGGTPLAAAEVQSAEPRRRLTVRVYNYTSITPRALRRTRQAASRVLATAGIEVRWEQCRTSETDTNQDESCSQRAGAHVIQLRIHPREMSKKLTSRSIEFGYSMPLEGGFGFIAGVYLDRTQKMARSMGLDLHVMLGHTIAHEIGHLLLGTNSHAKRGVMRATWGDREVRLASTGSLRFTEEQADRMLDQVERRLALVETSGLDDGQTGGRCSP